MNSLTSKNNSKCLERIWAADREHVRRMLIGLARDIDLADDLLQETYLKALNGMSSCRGDNDRAWLSTIARNLFFCHMRRHYVHAETADDDEAQTASCPSVGTPDHLDLIRIRQALSGLGPDLRTALLMKHYCGVTAPYHIGEGKPAGVRKAVRDFYSHFGGTGTILAPVPSIRPHWPWENTLAMIDEWKTLAREAE